MLKNILFLLACVALFACVWGVFQLFGQYVFLMMALIAFALIFAKIGKPKFGNNKDRPRE